ncbi:hypothetical protein ACP70R_025531 [Stipagrostis hirtigluma subsp. patula]
MAKVPDLGSDFAQKLLKDLRRRRERLGFESPAAKRSTTNATPRDSYSNSQKPPQVQKPRQAAPRVARAEAAANRVYQQGNNPIAGAGKPRRHEAPPAARSHDIVPFQGAGSTQKPATGTDMQMALALALSNSGKLQNIQLVARNGENYLLSPNAHVSKMAIEVQKLNDILMAYSSSGARGREFGRRGSVDIGKQLLRGAMDLEESLSMLVMLQEASDYMETSGNGKVLLLEGKESRRSSSARLVEIVGEDSEAEISDNENASVQIVPHSKSESLSPNHSSALQLATVTKSSKGSSSSGEQDSSKVRMPNLIAKLMGLENLPSAKVVAERKGTVAERKGTERFVKSEAVPRKATPTNATICTLPIQIVASERMPSKGQMTNFLARGWNITLTNSEESESATVRLSRSLHPTTDKQTRQTMKQVLSKERGSERRVSLSEVVDERINHGGMKLTEETKRQKPVTAGCRNDAGKRMGFLQRFRKNANNKPVSEERDVNVIQENNRTPGKKQTASMKLLLGRENEVKSRRQKEKFNKENVASTEAKAEGKNAKTDQVRKPAQTKKTDKQMVKKAQSYRQIQSEETRQNLEERKSLKPDGTHTKKKLEYNALIEQKSGKHKKVDDIRSSRPSGNTLGDDGMFEQSAGEKGNSVPRGTSSGQSDRQTTKEIEDPTSTAAQSSDGSKILDQSILAEESADRINHKASEAIQIPETFSAGEQQHQQQQLKEAKDQTRNGLDHNTASNTQTNLLHHKMHVVSCDAFTENQLLLMEMLLKDPYLLETAKAIAGIHVPVNFVNFKTGKWLDKSNQLLSDIGREVIRRKCKRTDAMLGVSMTCAANPRLQTLDELIRELDGDIQSVIIPKKPHQHSGSSPAEKLKMILFRDIQNTHSDANSMWDFGWNRISNLPIERNEVVKDLEKNILGGIITDVARELIEVSIHHGREA